MSEWHYEDHPEWYYDIPNMETLILGSFPPHCSKWYYPFYYPNIVNRFWKILRDVSGKPLTKFTKKQISESKQNALKERYAIMEELKIGIQNMGKKINRKGSSANDTDIIIEEYHDILGIIKAHKDLKQILLPGFHAKHSTYWSFIRYLNQNDIEVPNVNLKPQPHMCFTIRVGDKTVECIVLNSTSTASKINYGIVLEQFRKYILK